MLLNRLILTESLTIINGFSRNNLMKLIYIGINQFFFLTFCSFVYACDKPENETAYEFGLVVQNLIKSKDMNGLFNLVDGELASGPRRSFALSKSFDEIFDGQWIIEVLKNEPPCLPAGWRGYFLGNGLLWYSYISEEIDPSNLRIHAINGANSEVFSNLIGWEIDDQYLNPICFKGNWFDDEFTAVAKHFSIFDSQDFLNYPGKYYGREITDYSAISPDWCENSDCRKIPLIKSIAECLENKSELELDYGVKTKIAETNYHPSYLTGYKVIKDVDRRICSLLAPSMELDCLDSFYIASWEDHGGSMGRLYSYGIYGHFNFPKIGEHIVPLQYFDTLNDGLNFLVK